MTTKQKLITFPLMGLMLIAGGAIAGTTTFAGAQSTDATGATALVKTLMGRGAPHVDGTITGINGSTITITADANHGGGTYTIETSGATFTKSGASASLANFAVGEKVWAAGTVSGQNVVATTVSDRGGFGPGGKGGRGGHGVGGTVTAVNGSTITLTGMDGQTYTVEAGSATVERMVAGSLSDVVVGDRIGVHGAKNGTTVTATCIMDDMPEKPAQPVQ